MCLRIAKSEPTSKLDCFFIAAKAENRLIWWGIWVTGWSNVASDRLSKQYCVTAGRFLAKLPQTGSYCDNISLPGFSLQSWIRHYLQNDKWETSANTENCQPINLCLTRWFINPSFCFNKSIKCFLNFSLT